LNSFFEKRITLFGVLITVVAYFCFSIASACVRMLGSAIPTIEVLFFQNLISLLLIIPYCIKKKALTFPYPNFSLHLTRDLMGMLSYLTYFFAINHMNLVDATLLAYTAPFFTPLIWKIWTKESVNKHIWWAVILGFFGILIILKPGKTLLHPGALIGLLSGICTAISLVSIRLLNLKQISCSMTLFHYFFVATLMTLPFALIFWRTPSGMEYLYLIAIGLFISLGQIFLTTAYRHATASLLSPLSYLMILFTGGLSWLILHQKLSWSTLGGAVFIIVGGVLTFLLPYIRKNKSLS
jgi:drug/metabolite transporter (DMT)-like permease